MDIQKPNALRLAIRYIQDLCRSHTRLVHRAHPSYPVSVRENFESRVSRSMHIATKCIDTRNPLQFVIHGDHNVLEGHRARSSCLERERERKPWIGSMQSYVHVQSTATIRCNSGFQFRTSSDFDSQEYCSLIFLAISQTTEPDSAWSTHMQFCHVIY